MKYILPIFILITSISSCNQKQAESNSSEIDSEEKAVAISEKDTIREFKRIGLDELRAFNEKYESQWSDKPESFPYTKNNSYKVYQLGLVGECNKCEFKKRISSGIEISEENFQELIDILKNPDSYSNSTAACFDPKISIIAYDNENVATEFLSICLNCNNFRSYPGRIQIEHHDEYLKGFSRETRTKLREIFLKWGIDYYGFSSAWDDEAVYEEYLKNKNAPQH